MTQLQHQPRITTPRIEGITNNTTTSNHHNIMSSLSKSGQNSSSSSSEPELSAVQKWICPHTGKPAFSRYHEGNLEARTQAAADLFREKFYCSRAEAARELKVPYERLRSRLSGANAVTQNGGNRTLLTDIQEAAILCWAYRRVA